MEGAGRTAPCGTAGDPPRMSVVVVHYNDPDHLAACLAALRRDPGVGEIVVVDNASRPEVVAGLRSACLGVDLILSPSNLGFGGGANLGAERSSGEFLVFMNPDTVPAQGCMAALAEHLVNRGGVAGPVVRTGSGGDEEFGCTVDRMLLPRCMDHRGEPLYICGCCLAATRSCFEAVGGFDGRYFLFVEDVEFCWQALRRGYAVEVVPEAGLLHVGGAVADGGYHRGGRIETTSGRVLLRERNSWAALLACAPARHVGELVPLALVRTLAFTLLLGGRGAVRDVGRLWSGLVWNLAHLRGTLERRWRPGVTGRGEQIAWDRVSPQFFLWDLIRKRERLRFVDEASLEARS